MARCAGRPGPWRTDAAPIAADMNGTEGHPATSTLSPASVARSRRWRHRLGIAFAVLLAGLVWKAPSAYGAWRARNLNASESAAIAVLKNLSSAQAQLQASGALDVNHNGAGEYGTFAQLADYWRPATIGRQLSLSRLEFGGYVYELVLPAALADRETKWTCYAWPVEFGITGRRAFVITEGGDILMSQNDGRYEGERTPVLGRSGFRKDSKCPSQVAANTIDDEGDRWFVV